MREKIKKYSKYKKYVYILLPLIILVVIVLITNKPEDEVREVFKMDSPKADISVLAKIQDIKRHRTSYITEEQFSEELNAMDPSLNKYLSTKIGKDLFLNILIKERLTLMDANDSNTTKSKEYTEAVNQKQAELNAQLDIFKERMLVDLYLKNLKESKELRVTEKDIKNYYKDYNYEISISHILLTDPKKAVKVLKEAKYRQTNKQFSYLAKKHSLDTPTAKKGGKIPPFIPGEYIKEIEDPASNIKVGRVQGFFKTSYGYHIIRKNGEKKISYKKARERIKAILERQNLDKYFTELENRYALEVLENEQETK
ncbi:MAG: hypothetical protein HOB19_04155 [Elusimicrobiaceae bacterium]|nr:hypothetical protein [Elusimicrobiaceae bacterium]MBT4403075.1 hypothetical protein [Elusimicrobiaceae bacterium]MBT6715636.1 hypothetical protein [Elusimicrobiaceae bacterium]